MAASATLERPDSRQAQIGEVTLSIRFEEAELLRKICRSYRSSLPIYLRSIQGELALVDALLEKLD